MQNFFVFLLFLSLSLSGFGQSTILYPEGIFPANDLPKQYEKLNHLLPEIAHHGALLKEESVKRSPYSLHYTYKVYFQELPLYDNYVKIHTDKHHEMLSLDYNLFPLQELPTKLLLAQKALWLQKKKTDNLWLGTDKNKSYYLAIFHSDKGYEVVLVKKYWGPSLDRTELVNLDDEIIKEWNHLSYARKDTLIQTKVFNPDPLTAVQQYYGGTYADFNDAHMPWMPPAYETKIVSAIYDDNTNLFLLENSFVKIVDFEAPTAAPETSPLPNFYFLRNQSGFEDCMAMYHITHFHKYLTTLGYDTLMKLQLEVDAHGQFGADNSVFNRNGGAPQLSLGTGGVDDGEDADVIIHEYAHGICWSANGNVISGVERAGLDEGIGDYFATSYSRGLSSFRWRDMFTWDGHNEYWAGRTADTSLNYSTPMPGNLYTYGEVWNTAMQKIYTDIGKTTTDKLMLETLYFLSNTTTLPQAAQYMLQADTLLFSGANHWAICKYFALKNIIQTGCAPVQVDDYSHADVLKLKNSLAFSQGTGNLLVEWEHQPLNFQVLDAKGAVIQTFPLQEGRFELSPQAFPPGMYILRVQGALGIQPFKLIRF